MKNKSIKELNNSSDKVFYILNSVLLIIILLVVLYPLIYIVSCSFSSTSAVVSGRVWLFPVEPSLAGYKAVFKNSDILLGYGNTIFYTLFGTIINVVITIAAAYPLSRKDFKAGSAIMFGFAFTMFFNGGLVPTYLLVNSLGLINTRWAMLIPGALNVYNMIIVRTFFKSNIPDEILEAAQIDGCSDIKFVIRFVIPLSKAVIAVITLFYAVAHWNTYFRALIYLTSKKLYPLQIFLRDILIMNTVDVNMLSTQDLEAKEGLRELLKYSLIIVSSVPMLCLYPLVQKYFVKGVMMGSIKG